METQMTPEQARNSARFEAHLRGGKYRLISNQIVVVGAGSTTFYKPLDPTTDTGVLDAMELLQIGTVPSKPHGDWLANPEVTNAPIQRADSPRAAVLAAWLAAVEQWTKEQVDGE